MLADHLWLVSKQKGLRNVKNFCVKYDELQAFKVHAEQELNRFAADSLS